MTAEPFQAMPPLTPDEMSALEEDIAANGILVAVLVDQHGRVLDGHHRREIADKLGIDCPTIRVEVVDDEDARQVALRANLTRRHLSRGQRRELVRRELDRRPDDSDRVIARRLGCSPTTVGTVRRGVSKLDSDPTVPKPYTAVEARAFTDQVRATLAELAEDARPVGSSYNEPLIIMQYAYALGDHPELIDINRLLLPTGGGDLRGGAS